MGLNREILLQLNTRLMRLVLVAALINVSGCIGPGAISQMEVSIHKKANGTSKKFNIPKEGLDMNTVSGNLGYARALTDGYLQKAGASAVAQGILDIGIIGAAVGAGAVGVYAWDIAHLKTAGLVAGGIGLLGQYVRAEEAREYLIEAARKLACIVSKANEAAVRINRNLQAVSIVEDGILAIRLKLHEKLKRTPPSYSQLIMDVTRYQEGATPLSATPRTMTVDTDRTYIISDLKILISKCVVGIPII